MIASSVDWTMVITSLIVGLPAIIAAIGVLVLHRQVRTPSGKTLGEVAEYAHDTAIANNLLLSKATGRTKTADAATLSAEGSTPPQIPDPPAEASPARSGV